MDDFEQFSRAVTAITEAGAYGAKDIRDYVAGQDIHHAEKEILCTDGVPFDVSSEINRMLIDNMEMQEYERFRQEQELEKHQRILNSWPFRLVAFLNELIDAILNDIDIMGDLL